MKALILIVVILLGAGGLSVRGADGQKLYEANCAECHGDDGNGKTKMAEKQSLKMEFTDAKVQDRLKDEDIVKAIKEGVPDKQTKKQRMKPIEDLSDEEIKWIVAYVRGFKK